MRAKNTGYVGQHRNQTLNRVAENLYKSDQSGRYYALFERSGQQFRRSLKTTDRKLADRRLADLRSQITEMKDLTAIIQQNWPSFEALLHDLDWVRQVIRTIERSRKPN